jgi:hypothetical protein
MSLTARVDRTTDRTSNLRTLLVVSSIAAGLIHAAVVSEHLEEAWIFGLFFILAAGFQIAWAISVVLGRSVVIYAAGALANGAIMGIWLASRTIGVPIGPDAWVPEPAVALDVTATLLELLLVVGALVLFRQRVRGGGYGAPGGDLPW